MEWQRWQAGLVGNFPGNAYLFSTVDHRKEYVTFSFFCDSCTGPNLPIIDMVLYFLENVAHVRNTEIPYMSLRHIIITLYSVQNDFWIFFDNLLILI